MRVPLPLGLGNLVVGGEAWRLEPAPPVRTPPTGRPDPHRGPHTQISQRYRAAVSTQPSDSGMPTPTGPGLHCVPTGTLGLLSSPKQLRGHSQSPSCRQGSERLRDFPALTPTPHGVPEGPEEIGREWVWRPVGASPPPTSTPCSGPGPVSGAPCPSEAVCMWSAE